MKMFRVGLVLIFAGVVLLFTAIAISFFGIADGEVNVSAGGCVLIGFIPICFGVGENMANFILLALLLSIVLIITTLMLMFYASKELSRLTRGMREEMH